MRGCVQRRPGKEAAGRGGETMDETEELIELCVRSLAAQMIGGPGVELYMTRRCILGLTDEALADFNRLTLGADPDAEGFLIRAAARAKERGRPLSAVMSPQASRALAPVATRLGFTQVGTAPLMVLRPGVAIQPGRPVTVVRALGPELVAVAGDMIAAAFDEPRDVIARCIDVCMTETSGVETWIAFDDQAPMGTVSMTPTGDTAGVTLMATPPGRQRQGIGRALLTQVIADYRRRGVQRFHLGSSAAGRRLYDSLGFELVADLPVWILALPVAAPD
jgi:GNAT superfamily N-acetyltransferase